MTPAIVESKTLQQFTVSVPTENEGVATRSTSVSIPAGFAVDSYEAEPGWTRSVKQTGSGEEAVVQSVTWTGGSVPTGEDGVVRFNASANDNRTYIFDVRQTYSDGSVVDWAAPDSSDTPSPTVKGVSSIGGGGSSTLAIVARIVGGVGLLVGVVAVATGRRPLT